MYKTRSFSFRTNANDCKARFDDFIAWGEPGGVGGFDQAHGKLYDRRDSFFTLSTVLLPHSHKNVRFWLVRQEYLQKASKGGLFTKSRGGAMPEIKIPQAMIAPGRFLSFAKAYLNVYCEIRRLRSFPKPSLKALIFLEKALRNLNSGDNDPSNLSHQAFHQAALAIQRSRMAPGPRFDAGKALEHLALFVQAGGRFKGDKIHASFPGFMLINTSFHFRSPIKSPPKFGKKRITEDQSIDSGHLTSEDVAAIGLAYRRAESSFGRESVPTFFASLTGLTLTTASMRAAELQSLREDALYEKDGRPRLRIPRPKIGIEQDVPISKKLEPLAKEVFNIVRNHSAEARAAFSFYIAQSPHSIEGIHTLFIPSSVKPLLEPAYLTKEQAHAIIDPTVAKTNFPQRFFGFPLTLFVETPGDVYGALGASRVAKIRDVIRVCRGLPVRIVIPDDAHRDQYVPMKTAQKIIGVNGQSKAATLALRTLFSCPRAKKCSSYLSRDDVVAYLLDEFKRSGFPHWPYTSKDRSVRLDAALAVHFASSTNPHVQPGIQQKEWWLPQLLSIQTLNAWISGSSQSSPILFALTNVRLANGKFPSISVQRCRRYHHTAALLAGANPLFANELAGRQSGWQGEAYDYRTPREIVLGSIDTYDPDQGSDVIGPIADQAPPTHRIVERRAFFARNAAPKHVTEIGGCISDWSLNPCDQHGDCIRCNQHVWRKGDKVRMARVLEMLDEAKHVVAIGKAKLRKNQRLTSIRKQVRQKQEVITRCEWIVRIEADDAIQVGTIVTFPAAPTAMSGTERQSWLAKASNSQIVTSSKASRDLA